MRLSNHTTARAQTNLCFSAQKHARQDSTTQMCTRKILVKSACTVRPPRQHNTKLPPHSCEATAGIYSGRPLDKNHQGFHQMHTAQNAHLSKNRTLTSKKSSWKTVCFWKTLQLATGRARQHATPRHTQMTRLSATVKLHIDRSQERHAQSSARTKQRASHAETCGQCQTSHDNK